MHTHMNWIMFCCVNNPLIKRHEAEISVADEEEICREFIVEKSKLEIYDHILDCRKLLN